MKVTWTIKTEDGISILEYTPYEGTQEDWKRFEDKFIRRMKIGFEQQ